MSRFSNSWAKKTVQKQTKGDSAFGFDESSSTNFFSFGGISTGQLQQYHDDDGDQAPPTGGLDDDEMESSQMDFDDDEVHPPVATMRSVVPEPSILSPQNTTNLLIQALRRFEANGPNAANASLKDMVVFCEEFERKYKSKHKHANKLNQIKQERFTWKLLSQLEAFPSNTNAEVNLAVLPAFPDEKQLLHHLEEEDRDFLIAGIVQHWLESNSSEMHDVRVGEYPIVDKVDPDAKFRNGNLTASQFNERDDREEKLLEQLWLLIRSGRIHEAQALCRKSKQYWRAATLDGGRYCQKEGGNVEGNPHRNIWQNSCRELSIAATNRYEKAIYGSLCGNLEALNEVCLTWEDALWGLVSASRIARIEKRLRVLPENIFKNVDYAPHLRLHDINKDDFVESLASPSLIEIFDELDRKFGSAAGISTFYGLQRHLILFKFNPNFRPYLKNYLKACADSFYNSIHTQTLFVRFVVNLILVYFNGPEDEELRTEALEELLNRLIARYTEKKRSKARLITYYTSKLPPEKQVEVYVRFLASIVSVADKQSYLAEAESFNLDINEITKRLAASLLSRPDVEDPQKEHAIDWLIEASDKNEARQQSNHFIAQLLDQNKIDYAQAIIAKVEPKLWRNQIDPNQLADLELTLSEYAFYKDYCEFIRSYKTWQTVFQSPRPVRPQQPSTTNKKIITSQLTYETQLAKFNEAHIKRTEAEEYAADVLDSSVQKFLELSKVQHPTFTVNYHPYFNPPFDLRQKLFPSVVLMAQEVYNAVGRFSDALHLARILTHRLTPYFSKEQIQQFLVAASDSAIGELRRA